MNEDCGGVGPCAAWILDGATGVNRGEFFTSTSDAAWAVEYVASEIKHRCKDYSGAPAQLLRELAQGLRARLAEADYPDDFLPPAMSCGIAVCRDTGLEFTMAGDVLLYVPSTGKLVATEFFARREASAVRRAGIDLGNSSEDRLESDRRSIAARRRQYIFDGDPAILSSNPDVLTNLPTTSLQLFDGDQVLMCTDGFARAVASYGIFGSWEALFSWAAEHGLASVDEAIRAHEKALPVLDESHNYKNSDDTAALIFEYNKDYT